MVDVAVTLGIGQGSTGWDATMMSTELGSPRERSERFAEFVELTDLLLREPETTYVGRFYSVREARTYPGCVQALASPWRSPPADGPARAGSSRSDDAALPRHLDVAVFRQLAVRLTARRLRFTPARGTRSGASWLPN